MAEFGAADIAGIAASGPRASICGPDGRRPGLGRSGRGHLPALVVQDAAGAAVGRKRRRRQRWATEQLALACASHKGAAMHRTRVTAWLDDLGLAETDLRCGPQEPDDIAERDRLIWPAKRRARSTTTARASIPGSWPSRVTSKAGPEYVDPDHPVQLAVRAAFEEVTGEVSPGYGIDGCSAPNFATSVAGLARAMAAYATARDGASAPGHRDGAAARRDDAASRTGGGRDRVKHPADAGGGGQGGAQDRGRGGVRGDPARRRAGGGAEDRGRRRRGRRPARWRRSCAVSACSTPPTRRSDAGRTPSSATAAAVPPAPCAPARRWGKGQASTFHEDPPCPESRRRATQPTNSSRL